jgi:hypothetical protein
MASERNHPAFSQTMCECMTRRSCFKWWMKTVAEPSFSGGGFVKWRARFCQERGWTGGTMVGLGLPLWIELELDWRVRLM